MNDTSGDSRPQSAGPSWHANLHSFVALTGILIFQYVGTEVAVGGWIAAYMRRIGATAESYWAVTPALFYSGMLTGRALASVLLRRLIEVRLIFLSLIATFGGILVIILGQGLLTISVGAAGLMIPLLVTLLMIGVQAAMVLDVSPRHRGD